MIVVFHTSTLSMGEAKKNIFLKLLLSLKRAILDLCFRYQGSLKLEHMLLLVLVSQSKSRVTGLYLSQV